MLIRAREYEIFFLYVEQWLLYENHVYYYTICRIGRFNVRSMEKCFLNDRAYGN
jgi:hypothetical protein